MPAKFSSMSSSGTVENLSLQLVQALNGTERAAGLRFLLFLSTSTSSHSSFPILLITSGLESPRTSIAPDKN